MANLSTKYLDLSGLQLFWTNAKNYIATQISTSESGLNQTISDNDAAIRAYVESLTVNGVQVTKSPEGEGKGTGLSVTIKGNNITVGGDEGDYKDMTVDAAINAVDGRVDALEDHVKQGVVNKFEVEVNHDSTEGDEATVWVTATADNSVGDVTLTIDDTAIDAKFEEVDQKIITLEANAGVVGAKVVDTNKDSDNFVTFTVENRAEDETLEGGYKKGLLTFTVDETALDEKVTALVTADSNEAASRKADIEALAGSNYTAGVNGAAGSWTEGSEPAYPTIQSLSERVKTISDSVVTEVTVKDESNDKTNYVTLSASNGTGDIVLTLNDSALEDKIDELAKADSDEAAARKADIEALAGDDWTTGQGWTGSTTTYHDITSIGQGLEAAQEQIEALASATHFRGVFDKLEDVTSPANGDVVIVGAKEYIYSKPGEDAGSWVELGDTTVENQRIGALEDWVDNNVISNSEINSMFV